MGEKRMEMKEGVTLPTRMRAGTRNEVDAMTEWLCTKPFDQTLAAYYPSDTIEKYNLTTANRTLAFTRTRLQAADYRGWYVIVVHDKQGSTLWHPHLLLDGRDNQVKRVMRKFFPYADINYKTRGPVIDLECCARYMARRACETGLDSDKYEFAFMGDQKQRHQRGSRGKGRSKNSEKRTAGQPR